MEPRRGSSGEVRIGDSDRAEGKRLLNEHLAAGRLTPEEFGDRAVQAEQARSRADLLLLFRDLPAPHPVFDASPSTFTPRPATAPRAPRPAAPRPKRKPIPAERKRRYLAVAVVGPAALGGCMAAGIVVLNYPVLIVPILLLVAFAYKFQVLGDRLFGSEND